MADMIIKPSTGNDLVIQGGDNSPAITVGNTGTTTFAENATMSGTLGVTGATTCSTTLGVTGNTTLSGSANALGTVTSGSLEGTTWRRFNGVSVYGGDDHQNSGLTAHWETSPNTGSPTYAGWILNSDNCIDWTDSGTTFTIDSAGVYFIYAQVIPFSSTGSQTMAIKRNGNILSECRISAGSNHNTCQTTTVPQLSVDDIITVTAGAVMHAGYYCNFSMFKLGEA